MDKEDCIEVLLSTLKRPEWRDSSSVTDGDLKNVLWGAGLLLTPDQAIALLADMKRRGLIAARERRSDSRITGMWGVRVTTTGDDWLLQRAALAFARQALAHRPVDRPVQASQRAPATSRPEGTDRGSREGADTATSTGTARNGDVPLSTGERAIQGYAPDSQQIA